MSLFPICKEEKRHKNFLRARAEIELYLMDYAAEHAISAIDMMQILMNMARTTLNYIDRDDEEQRTGFRHRMAGE